MKRGRPKGRHLTEMFSVRCTKEEKQRLIAYLAIIRQYALTEKKD